MGVPIHTRSKKTIKEAQTRFVGKTNKDSHDISDTPFVGQITQRHYVYTFRDIFRGYLDIQIKSKRYSRDALT